MNESIIQNLLEINRNFYETFGESFASTRRHIQPGVRRFLNEIATDGNWLDLGCGSGALGAEWALTGLKGYYLGVDFSDTLLNEAKALNAEIPGSPLAVKYARIDLLDDDWDENFEPGAFDGITAFAVFHHIPSVRKRQAIFAKAARLLRNGGLFCYSVWQFYHSPKLVKRIIPWETQGFSPEMLDEGDVLLDWRAEQNNPDGVLGIRYVHHFSEDELTNLAISNGFAVCDRWQSDGKSGDLALYQVAKKQ